MNENVKNFIGFVVIYGIPAIMFLRWKYKNWRQEKEETEPEPEQKSSTSMDHSQ